MSQKTSDQLLFGILAYLWILCFVPLLAKKDDAWVQEHARQGLALFILWVIVVVVGWFLGVLGWILSVLLLVIWIIEIIKVVQGESPWEIPVIGPAMKNVKF